MGVDFLDRRVLAKRVVDGRKPASGHESQLRQVVASGHPQGRSAAKEPQSGLTRRNPLTLDPTCCGFSHSLFAIYARFYAAVNIRVSELERRQMRAAREELDREYEARNGLGPKASAPARQAEISSTSRT